MKSVRDNDSLHWLAGAFDFGLPEPRTHTSGSAKQS
jgi:hypothetical protein